MKTLKISRDGRGVATVVLSRPDRHNAMSGKMMDELREAAEILGADSCVRVVVLAAEGRTFCAGADLGWMREQAEADSGRRQKEAMRLAAMLGALAAVPKPVIGRVQGSAYGGGVGLMAVCDSAVAVDTARFGFTETRLGLIPATISPYVVARLGEGVARRYLMSGRIFDGAEAKAIGLVTNAVPEAKLDEAVEREVIPYLECAPGAVAEAKSLSMSLGARIGPKLTEGVTERLVARWDTKEAREGISAFFDKREPEWRR